MAELLAYCVRCKEKKPMKNQVPDHYEKQEARSQGELCGVRYEDDGVYQGPR